MPAAKIIRSAQAAASTATTKTPEDRPSDEIRARDHGRRRSRRCLGAFADRTARTCQQNPPSRQQAEAEIAQNAGGPKKKGELSRIEHDHEAAIAGWREFRCQDLRREESTPHGNSGSQL